jgi:nitrate reductase NapAB chaperone NapD
MRHPKGTKEENAMQTHPKKAEESVFPENLAQGFSSGMFEVEAEETSAKPHYVVVGVLCRVDPLKMREICASINALEGMETFSLGEKGRVGALIEAVSFDQAHERLQEDLLQVEGVQAAWPISTQWE